MLENGWISQEEVDMVNRDGLIIAHMNPDLTRLMATSFEEYTVVKYFEKALYAVCPIDRRSAGRSGSGRLCKTTSFPFVPSPSFQGH